MRSDKKIIIDIDERGNCSIEGKGFVGPECAEFTGEIEKSLGKVTSITNKREYRQTNLTRGMNKQIGGRS